MQTIDIEAEIERILAGSPPNQSPPTFALILGPVASGKTRFRRQHYASGFVVLDAGEIFITLCQGKYLEAPTPEMMIQIDKIGFTVAQRAIAERRHLVTEMIGDNQIGTELVINRMTAHGYATKLEALTVDLERSLAWNESRGASNISAFHTQPTHARWICGAK